MSSEQQPPTDDDFTFTIQYNRRTGSVRVDGPVHDPALCYGMLELGKDIVRAAMMQAAAQQQRITRPSFVVPPEFQRRRP